MTVSKRPSRVRRFNRQLHVVLVGHSDSDTTSVGAYLDAHTELRCSVIVRSHRVGVSQVQLRVFAR